MIISPPEAASADVLDFLRSLVRFRPAHFQARTSLAEVALRSTSANDRYGFGTRECSRRLASTFPRHHSCVAVPVRSVRASGHTLFMTAALPLTPAPLLRQGAGPLSLRCHSAPSACFSGFRCRAAALPPSLRSSDITAGHFSHPQGKRMHGVPPDGIGPNPKPQRAVRRWTALLRQMAATASLTPSGLRPTARRGRL